MADSILIEFMLDDANFRANIQKSTSEVDKLQGKVKDTKAPVGDLKSGFNETATAIGGAAVKAAAFAAAAAAASAAFVFVKGIESASATQAALQKAADAMGRFGDFSRAALNDISGFADGLQKTAGIADEATLSAFALAKSFGLTNEQAKLVVSTSADMSAALGTDLNETVKQLSETYEGHIGKLGKVIVGVEGAATANARLGAVVELASKQFNGAASGALKGYSGAILETKLSFEDFTKSIGRLIVDNPAVESTIRALSKAFDAISESVNKNAGSLRVFIAEGIVQLLKSVKEVIAVFKIFQKVFEDEAVNPFDSYDKSIQSMKEGLESARDTAIEFVGAFAGAAQVYLETSNAFNKATNAFGVNDEALAKNTALLEKIKGLEQALANRETQVPTDKGLSQVSSLDPQFQPGKIKQDDKSSPILAGLDKLIASIETQIKTGAVTGGTSGVITPTISNQIAAPIIDDFTKAFDPLGVILESFGDTVADITKYLMENPAVKSLIDSTLAGIEEGGRSGANTAVAGAAQAGALALGADPELAKAIGGIFKTLGSDPDTFKNMIEGFVKGIPSVIKAIIVNIPVLIKALADGMPDIIVALANGAPEIVAAIVRALLNPQLYLGVARGLADAAGAALNNKFAKLGESVDHFQNSVHSASAEFAGSAKEAGGAISQAFQSAGTAIAEFFKSIPDKIAAGFSAIIEQIKDVFIGPDGIFSGLGDIFADAGQHFLKALLDGAEAVVKKITPGSGGGGGGVVTQTYHKILGHATGGTVPEGFPNDNYPAFLTSGETVLPKDDVQRLRSLVDRGGGSQGGDNSTQTLLLAQMLDLLKKPQTVTSTAQVDGRAFADVILTLSRSNQRFA